MGARNIRDGVVIETDDIVFQNEFEQDGNFDIELTAFEPTRTFRSLGRRTTGRQVATTTSLVTVNPITPPGTNDLDVRIINPWAAPPALPTVDSGAAFEIRARMNITGTVTVNSCTFYIQDYTGATIDTINASRDPSNPNEWIETTILTNPTTTDQRYRILCEVDSSVGNRNAQQEVIVRAPSGPTAPEFNVTIIPPTRTVASGTNFTLRARINVVRPPITISTCEFRITDPTGTYSPVVITGNPVAGGLEFEEDYIINLTGPDHDFNIEAVATSSAGLVRSGNGTIRVTGGTPPPPPINNFTITFESPTSDVPSGSPYEIRTRLDITGTVTITSCEYRLFDNRTGAVIKNLPGTRRSRTPTREVYNAGDNITLPPGVTEMEVLAECVVNSGIGVRTESILYKIISGTPPPGGDDFRVKVVDPHRLIGIPTFDSGQAFDLRGRVEVISGSPIITDAVVNIEDPSGTIVDTVNLTQDPSRLEDWIETRRITNPTTTDQIYTLYFILDTGIIDRSASQQVKIRGSTGPVASFTVEDITLNNSRVTSGDPLIIKTKVNAIGGDVTIENCEFLISVGGRVRFNPITGTYPVLIPSGSSMEFEWGGNAPNTLSTVSHKLVAEARDNAGNTIRSKHETILIIDPKGTTSGSFTVDDLTITPDNVEGMGKVTIKTRVNAIKDVIITKCNAISGGVVIELPPAIGFPVTIKAGDSAEFETIIIAKDVSTTEVFDLKGEAEDDKGIKERSKNSKKLTIRPRTHRFTLRINKPVNGSNIEEGTPIDIEGEVTPIGSVTVDPNTYYVDVYDGTNKIIESPYIPAGGRTVLDYRISSPKLVAGKKYRIEFAVMEAGKPYETASIEINIIPKGTGTPATDFEVTIEEPSTEVEVGKDHLVKTKVKFIGGTGRVTKFTLYLFEDISKSALWGKDLVATSTSPTEVIFETTANIPSLPAGETEHVYTYRASVEVEDVTAPLKVKQIDKLFRVVSKSPGKVEIEIVKPQVSDTIIENEEFDLEARIISGESEIKHYIWTIIEKATGNQVGKEIKVNKGEIGKTRISTPGVYQIHCDAVGTKGVIKDSKEVEIEVMPSVPLSVKIKPENNSTFNLGDSIYLEAELIGTLKGKVGAYEWDIYLGTEKQPGLVERTDKTTSNVPFTPDVAGTYKVKCIVHDSSGLPIAISEVHTLIFKSEERTLFKVIQPKNEQVIYEDTPFEVEIEDLVNDGSIAGYRLQFVQETNLIGSAIIDSTGKISKVQTRIKTTGKEGWCNVTAFAYSKDGRPLKEEQTFRVMLRKKKKDITLAIDSPKENSQFKELEAIQFKALVSGTEIDSIKEIQFNIMNSENRVIGSPTARYPKLEARYPGLPEIGTYNVNCMAFDDKGVLLASTEMIQFEVVNEKQTNPLIKIELPTTSKSTFNISGQKGLNVKCSVIPGATNVKDVAWFFARGQSGDIKSATLEPLKTGKKDKIHVSGFDAYVSQFPETLEEIKPGNIYTIFAVPLTDKFDPARLNDIAIQGGADHIYIQSVSTFERIALSIIKPERDSLVKAGEKVLSKVEVTRGDESKITKYKWSIYPIARDPESLKRRQTQETTAPTKEIEFVIGKNFEGIMDYEIICEPFGVGDGGRIESMGDAGYTTFKVEGNEETTKNVKIKITSPDKETYETGEKYDLKVTAEEGEKQIDEYEWKIKNLTAGRTGKGVRGPKDKYQTLSNFGGSIPGDYEIICSAYKVGETKPLATISKKITVIPKPEDVKIIITKPWERNAPTGEIRANSQFRVEAIASNSKDVGMDYIWYYSSELNPDILLDLTKRVGGVLTTGRTGRVSIPEVGKFSIICEASKQGVILARDYILINIVEEIKLRIEQPTASHGVYVHDNNTNLPLKVVVTGNQNQVISYKWYVSDQRNETEILNLKKDMASLISKETKEPIFYLATGTTKLELPKGEYSLICEALLRGDQIVRDYILLNTTDEKDLIKIVFKQPDAAHRTLPINSRLNAEVEIVKGKERVDKLYWSIVDEKGAVYKNSDVIKPASDPFYSPLAPNKKGRYKLRCGPIEKGKAKPTFIEEIELEIKAPKLRVTLPRLDVGSSYATVTAGELFKLKCELDPASEIINCNNPIWTKYKVRSGIAGEVDKFSGDNLNGEVEQIINEPGEYSFTCSVEHKTAGILSASIYIICKEQTAIVKIISPTISNERIDVNFDSSRAYPETLTLRATKTPDIKEVRWFVINGTLKKDFSSQEYIKGVYSNLVPPPKGKDGTELTVNTNLFLRIGREEDTRTVIAVGKTETGVVAWDLFYVNLILSSQPKIVIEYPVRSGGTHTITRIEPTIVTGRVENAGSLNSAIWILKKGGRILNKGRVELEGNEFGVPLNKEIYSNLDSDKILFEFAIAAAKDGKAVQEVRTSINILVKIEEDDLIKDLNALLASMRDQEEIIERVKSEATQNGDLRSAGEHKEILEAAAEFEETGIQPAMARFEDKIKGRIASGKISETKGAHLLAILNVLKSYDKSREGLNWRKEQYWMRQGVKWIDQNNYKDYLATVSALVNKEKQPDKTGVEWPIGDLPRRIQLLDVKMRETILMTEEEFARIYGSH